MKIMIYGYSGSGKSTIAKIISEEYSLPILYVDKILHNENWVRKDKEESKNLIASFLKQNKNWVIDGNAVSFLFEERAQMADKVIFMNFSRWVCYKQAKERYKKYKNTIRESAPDGCSEKFDFSFKWWVLFEGRKAKRKAKFENLVKSHPGKIIVLKNKKDVQYFLNNMDIILLK